MITFEDAWSDRIEQGRYMRRREISDKTLK